MATLAVKSWERFQHYKDRDPPWVKLYRDTLTSESWVLGSDLSRVIQVASMLLAPRYENQIPYRFDLLKEVMHLKCTEAAFKKAVEHLVDANFLEIQQGTRDSKVVAQSASTTLATCTSETETETETETDQSRDRTEKRQNGHETVVPTDVDVVFDHWRQTHQHPKAKLDAKRAKLIRDQLKVYSAADLCESITGYLNSPFHMGQNDRNTVYDDIENFLRDSKHIDAGIRHARDPPQASNLSKLSRDNLTRVADWVPPEMRNAAK